MLAEARPRLAPRYPTCAEFRTLAPGGPPFEPRPRRLLEPDAAAGVDAGEFDAAYLGDRRNPRWVATPTVAYLWARMTIGTRTSGREAFAAYLIGPGAGGQPREQAPRSRRD